MRSHRKHLPQTSKTKPPNIYLLRKRCAELDKKAFRLIDGKLQQLLAVLALGGAKRHFDAHSKAGAEALGFGEVHEEELGRGQLVRHNKAFFSNVLYDQRLLEIAADLPFRPDELAGRVDAELLRPLFAPQNNRAILGHCSRIYARANAAATAHFLAQGAAEGGGGSSSRAPPPPRCCS